MVPSDDSCLNDVDDDCDGVVNNGSPDVSDCVCLPNALESCYEGPAGTEGVGVCAAGTRTCDALGTGWSGCTGAVMPSQDVCSNDLDDDCDGIANNGYPAAADCVCEPGASEPCYTGPAGTEGIGVCQGGTRVCESSGRQWGPCTGEVTPAPDSCLNDVDDDCDGIINNGFPSAPGCGCVPGAEESCYTGPAGTADVGVCRAGTRTCKADGSDWEPCAGEITPSLDVCSNSVDDDCDGIVNNGYPAGAGACVCLPGSVRNCYSGPPGTLNVGVCRGGTQQCNALGTAWGSCTGEVTPSADVCTNSVDDDCDGIVNNGYPSAAGCVCKPGAEQGCYTGPAGTQGVGVCVAGARMCDPSGASWGECVGQVVPSTDVCTNSLDDNCDGIVNNGGPGAAGCVCQPNAVENCYTGPDGTIGVGVCRGGQRTCFPSGTGWSACTGEVTPSPEICGNGLDEDCSGAADDPAGPRW